MTTENIEGVDEIIAGNNTVANSTRDRSRELVAVLTELDQKQDVADREAEIARRVIWRRFEDRRVPLTHEAKQLAECLGLVVSSTSAPAPVDTTPPTPDPTEPVAPATATATAVAAVVNSDDNRRPSCVNPQHWTPWAWVLAFAGAIVGILVASATWEDLVGDISGTGRGWVTTFWWISLIGFGFFSGGAFATLMRSFVDYVKQYEPNQWDDR